MLTKNDLNAIQGIVEKSIDKRVTPLENKMDKMEKSMRQGFKRAHKEDGEILNYLEKENQKINSRVVRLEQHAGFPAVN